MTDKNPPEQKPAEDQNAAKDPAKDQETESKAAKTKKARALLDCTVGGKAYKANALVEDTAAVIAEAEKQGAVDSHKDAVALADVPKVAKKEE